MSTLLMDTPSLYPKNNKGHCDNKKSSNSNNKNSNILNNNSNNKCHNSSNSYIRSNSSNTYSSSNSISNENDNNEVDNIINLKLKKPKKWNWELSTSKSSPNIAFPRICLYDHRGTLLAEADEADQVYGNKIEKQTTENKQQLQKENETPSTLSSITSESICNNKIRGNNISSNISTSSGRSRSKSRQRVSSSSSYLELNESLNAFVDYLENEGINYKLKHHSSSPSDGIKHSKSISNIPQFKNTKSGAPSLSSSSSSIYHRRSSISAPCYFKDNVNIDDRTKLLPIIIQNNEESDSENASILNNRSFKSSPSSTKNSAESDYRTASTVNEGSRRKFDLKQIGRQRSLSGSLSSKLENLSNLSNCENSDSNEWDIRYNSRKNLDSIEVTEAEEPIWVQSGKGLLKRDMNAKEFDHLRPQTYKKSKSVNLDSLVDRVEDDIFKNRKTSGTLKQNSSLRKTSDKLLVPQKEVRFDLQKSKSATELLPPRSSDNDINDETNNSQNKTRRNNSNETPSKFSKSILERMSAHRMGSSTESQEIHISTVNHGPRYFLRSSRAGTLVICEDVNHNRRRRPRSAQRLAARNEIKTSPVKDQAGPKNLTNNKDKKFYDEAINKLDNLLSKVNIRQKENKQTLIKQTNLRNSNPILLEEKDKSKGKSIENVSEKLAERKKSEIGMKQQQNVRRCISAGNIYLSSSEDENLRPPKKEVKLRRRRKTPVKYHKGENIFALKSGNLSTDIQSVHKPITNVIKNESSDDILLRFMESLSSFQQYPVVPDNKCQDYNEYLSAYNNNNNTTTDSVLKDDNKINFEVIRRNSSNNKIQRNYNSNSINNSYNNNNNNNYNDGYNSPVNYIDSNKNLNFINNSSNNNNNNNALFQNDLKFNRNDSLSLKENPSDILDFVVSQNTMGSSVSRNSSRSQQSEATNRPRRRTHSSVNNHHHNNSQTEVNATTSTLVNSTSPSSTTTTTPSNTVIVLPTDCAEYVIPSSNRNQLKYQHNHQQLLQHQLHHQEQNYPSSYNDTNNISRSNSNVGCGIGSNNTSIVCVNHCNFAKENSASSSSDNNNNSSNDIPGNKNIIGSTSKIKQVKPDLQLTLPITRTNFDPSCDQGYGSERSPEDELPPLLPNFNANKFEKKQRQHPTTMMMSEYPINGNNENECCEHGNDIVYNFITEDCTFTVQIVKGSRGLGFSICGGVDTNTAFPGLIRIKRLFPHQAAWSTGKLQAGDIILESNGIPLTGLTNYEALEVLRTLPNDVELLICRPVDEQYKKLSPPTEPPKPPQRNQQQSIQTQTALEDMGVIAQQYQQQQQQLTNPSQYFTDVGTSYSTATMMPTNCYGEFEIFMIKQQGSLGFTIHKEDESVLGHYVRALVREPATTDGRIKPGDKIVAVNDIPLSPMTHEQAVIFLRQSGDVVKLRLYRDELNTPDEPPSPTITERENSIGGSSSSYKKPHLRPEAINLLTDLAHKKQNSQGDSTESSNLSTSSSPRRLKRGHKSQSEQDASDSKSSTSNPVYLVSSQTTTLCSDSEQSIDSQCSYIIQPGENIIETISPSGKSNRPNYLDLSNSNNSDGNIIRKGKYQFGACSNTYELNNLNNDELDAPILHHSPNHPHHSNHPNSNNNKTNISSVLPPSNNEFNSLPCDVLLSSSDKYSESEFNKDENDKIANTINNICHKNPLYQSANVQQQSQADNNFENSCQIDLKVSANVHGNESLLKWKGVVLSVDGEGKEKQNENKMENSQTYSSTLCILATDSSADRKNSLTEETTNYNLEKDTVDGIISSPNVMKKQQFTECKDGYKIASVELNRGWNSRLGFSLQPSKEFQNKSYISAIYNDSVAARDGRLRVGDVLISVNEESIENMSTAEIIDFLRIIRGAILITVLRKDSTKEQQKPQN